MRRHVTPPYLTRLGITVEGLARHLYDEWQSYYWYYDAEDDTDDTSCGDVRLVVRWDLSEFAVNFGLSDFDQWHGYCGASGYDPSQRPTRKQSRSMARDLISRVVEMIPEGVA